MGQVINKEPISENAVVRPEREEALEAVRTLLRWVGEDINREGLRDTPNRFIRAFDEYFSGYGEDPHGELVKVFEDVKNYNDIILLKGIRFHSHCEHHLAPIIGVAHVGYLPDSKVVGISKLARVVDIFARRLQTQEVMTCDIVRCIQDSLLPRGVAVMIEAEHHCMSLRGVKKSDVMTVTRHFSGVFADEGRYRSEIINLFSF